MHISLTLSFASSQRPGAWGLVFWRCRCSECQGIVSYTVVLCAVLDNCQGSHRRLDRVFRGVSSSGYWHWWESVGPFR
eukprot:3428276-Pyramimonas_sp.AAC.1